MNQTKLLPNYIRLLIEIKRMGGKARPYTLSKTMNISASVLYENLLKLMALGFLEKTQEGYALTPKGEEFLKQLKNEFQRIAEVI
jgi:Mn-dependent DtxR family transcriptional regulator